MADFPTSIYSPRVMTNLPGLTRDVADTKNLYAEDYNGAMDEIVAIETYLKGSIVPTVDITPVGNVAATPLVPFYSLTIPANKFIAPGDSFTVDSYFGALSFIITESFSLKFDGQSIFFLSGDSAWISGGSFKVQIRVVRIDSTHARVFGIVHFNDQIFRVFIGNTQVVDFTTPLVLDFFADSASDDNLEFLMSSARMEYV